MPESLKLTYPSLYRFRVTLPCLSMPLICSMPDCDAGSTSNTWNPRRMWPTSLLGTPFCILLMCSALASCRPSAWRPRPGRGRFAPLLPLAGRLLCAGVTGSAPAPRGTSVRVACVCPLLDPEALQSVRCPCGHVRDAVSHLPPSLLPPRVVASMLAFMRGCASHAKGQFCPALQ